MNIGIIRVIHGNAYRGLGMDVGSMLDQCFGYFFYTARKQGLMERSKPFLKVNHYALHFGNKMHRKGRVIHSVWDFK